MKIVKYILLLLVLAIISLTVFIATQSSDYKITKSKEIELPRHTVFNYLNDFKNFEQWQVFNEGASNFKLDSISKGNNGGITWNSNHLKNISTYPNDSLVQNLTHGDVASNFKWILKTTPKGTLLTLDISGKMDFITKFKAFFLGGIDKMNGALYEKTLNNINHHLIEEYSKFTIKNEGIVLINETFYIKQTVSSEIDELGDKIFTSMKTMKTFCEENDLKINGDPFTLFESINFKSGKVDYSVCLPITSEIYTNEGSDIMGGKIESFYAYKTILTGDYSHSDKAWNENKKGLTENNLTTNFKFKSISIYKKSILDSNKPSEWITEILTPVNESVIYKPETKNDTLVTIN